MSTETPQPLDEEALRAAYEEQLRQLRVEHVLLDTVVTLVNLGMRRSGLVQGTESERDPGQVQLAIEAVRAHMPLLERVAPEQIGAIRDALAQLQLAYVQIGGAPSGSPVPGGAEPESGRDDAGAGDGAPESGVGGGAPQAPPQPAQTPPAAGDAPVGTGEPGPAQRSGRLWVPGQ